MKTIAVDFETFYDTKQDYGIKQLGMWHYVHDNRFDPYLISVCDGENSWAGHPKDFNWAALEGARLLSHNRAFDQLVWEASKGLNGYSDLRPNVFGPPLDLRIADWQCTANMTAALCNRRSLDQSCEYLLGTKVDKSARADMDGKQWNNLTPAERTRITEYAKGDAVLCHTLWTKHSDRWPDAERALSNQTIEACWRGIAIDCETLDRNIRDTHEMLAATEKLLPWIEEGRAPTSPKAVAEQCRRVGIPCPPVKSDDEEGFIEWETKFAPLHSWIAAVSSRRSINKLLSTFKTIKSRIRHDGTFPFGLKYFGAHTGRWSGDAGVNIQNPRKEPVLRNEVGLMETDEARIKSAFAERDATGKFPAWVTAAIDERAVYVARPGKKLIMSDLSQIEPRVLNWMAGNHALLAKISGGMAIYEAFAREFMGWTGGKLKDEDKGRYALAKAQVLGLGYQCGWEKFITVAQTMAGIDITKDDPEFDTMLDQATGEEKQVSGYGKFSKKCVTDFRAANPRIMALWKRLDEQFKSSVGGDFTMTLPSGRRMTYPKVRREVRMKADENGKPKKDWYFTADVGGRRLGFYGGKLTENLVQAASRDVFGEHLLAIDKSGVGRVLFSAHDEAVVECDITTDKEEIVRIMSKTPEWLEGCPLSAEAVESNCYLK